MKHLNVVSNFYFMQLVATMAVDFVTTANKVVVNVLTFPVRMTTLVSGS